jgi:hypothetical protein
MTVFKLLAVLAMVLFPGRKSGRTTDYETVVNRVAEMVWDSSVWDMASAYGLDIVNVTWEDTGRYYGSCWGPNISDMTIQVHHGSPDNPTLTCMPVIRHPNFHDLSADIDPDHFFLLTGNEWGADDLRPVSLSDYIDNLRFHLNDPWCWPGRYDGLLCDRDSLVLVSAQAVFLPIQDSCTATFNPVLFNYQSYEENPAVLTILATREGTSVTIIDNVRDGVPGAWSWGQRLFFNEDGMRASLTGQRISDFLEENAGSDFPSIEAAGEEGLNMVLLIQIPLKQKVVESYFGFDELCYDVCASETVAGASLARSDVEAAVIGHGDLEGPFTEIDGLKIERDIRFPIRVTVQFYKATSNGMASEEDIREIAEQIERVYDDAAYVGSLVVPEPDEYRSTDWNRNDVARRLTPFWEAWRTKYLASIGRLDLLSRWNER